MKRTKHNIKYKKPGPKRVFSKEQLKHVELISKLGATNDQLAEFFGVVPDTIQDWLSKHKDFKKARKRGGIMADLKVVQALYKRATGYDFYEKEMKVVMGQLKTFKVKKHVIPDVKAIIHWLRNRQRELWTVARDLNIAHEHSGKVEHIHESLKDIPTEELSPEARDVLFEITKKQLTEGTRDN